MMATDSTNVLANGFTVLQRVAICFAAGVTGALAVVVFSHILFALGLGEILGVNAPVSLKSPEVYRPLFWGGLWGIPFGLLINIVWTRLYLFGFLYFLAPVLALFTIFLPMSGAGVFRASAGRANVHAVPAAGKFSVRDSHGFGGEGNHGQDAINILDQEGEASGLRCSTACEG